MGLIVATINKQYMMAYKNDLEYKIMLIKQAKMNLSETTKDLLNAGTDLDPENPAVKQLMQRRERLNMLEKKLDMELEEYEVKLQMVNKTMEASDQMIKDSIK